MDTEIRAFALALWELGKEEKSLKIFEQNAKHTQVIFQKHQELLKFFKSYFVTNIEKNQVLDEIFENNVAPLFLNFLKILNTKKMLPQIDLILEKFFTEINLENNILSGFVYSTQPITKVELKKIENFVNKKLAKKTRLKNRIDISLISGIKIQVGDFVLEDNVKNQLEQVKNNVFKGGE